MKNQGAQTERLTPCVSERERLIEAVRCLNELADVSRAICVASRLVAEKLEKIEADLVRLIGQEERQGLR